MKYTTWAAIDKNGNEVFSNSPLFRDGDGWSILSEDDRKIWSYIENGDPDDFLIFLPKGSIKKLTGEELTWKMNPIEIK